MIFKNLDARFGFGFLRRSTAYIPVGVRGHDVFVLIQALVRHQALFSSFRILCLGVLLCGCSVPVQTLKGDDRALNHVEQNTVRAVFSAPKRLAVVIGINEFDDPKWNSLKYAVKDANDMAGVLNDARYGQFDKVVALTGPQETTKERILQAVKDLTRANLSPQDTVVFYVSSHGTLSRTKDGRLHQYIVARDTKFKDISSTAIDVTELRRSFNLIKSQKRVMILAFCHSGKGKSQLDDAMMAELSDIKSPFFVKPINTVSEATIVLAASAWGETAREDRVLENDIYTHFLIEGIKKNDINGDGAVTVTEAHDYAREQTYYLTQGEQRPSIESVILGVDPVVLSGEVTRTGKPVIYDYSRRYEDLVVSIDGEKKGTLPVGVPVEPGVHLVELSSDKGGDPLYYDVFKINDGEQLSIPLLLNGYDQGTSIRFGYQGFLTEKVDRSVSNPLPMLGIAYSNHSYFSPRLGYRLDLSYGKDTQQLDVGPVTATADVSQTSMGAALIYRYASGSMAWYTGPRLGGFYLTRDLDVSGASKEDVGTFTFGAILGLHLKYKDQVSFALESAVNYVNISLSETDTSSVFYNVFGALSVNF